MTGLVIGKIKIFILSHHKEIVIEFCDPVFSVILIVRIKMPCQQMVTEQTILITSMCKLVAGDGGF